MPDNGANKEPVVSHLYALSNLLQIQITFTRNFYHHFWKICKEATLLPSATKLRQENIFTPVCHSVHRRRVSTSVQAGIHPPGRPPPGQHLLPRKTHPWADTAPPQADGYCSGRYASYWNAFLLAGLIFVLKISIEFDNVQGQVKVILSTDLSVTIRHCCVCVSVSLAHVHVRPMALCAYLSLAHVHVRPMALCAYLSLAHVHVRPMALCAYLSLAHVHVHPMAVCIP